MFDILRATSTMMTALANGAREIVPVSEIEEALAVRRSRPEVILAGERNGLRIGADQTGGVEFDLGNSPREFSVENVSGKTIIMTTTNGTRALRACTAARTTLIGSFLGLRAIANWITAAPPRNLLLVCAGTLDQAAYEDALAAGGLCELICPDDAGGTVSDSAQIARQLYRAAQEDLFQAAKYGRNARRLLANPELRDDVAICLRRDVFGFLAGLSKDGAVRRLS
ncbi:MAG: 2-phosphosulfolactate phosphatase [Verrucomicrobia bacterium]|nr:2-phosphosulfolactate phosphatase [Verrucomicrobiota bacterium]